MKHTLVKKWIRQADPYLRLMRVDRPIGIYLVLWPALWALWLAAEGFPDVHLLLIFAAGAAIMRSAGCVINDFADRKIDGHVQRTQSRPLVNGEISSRHALILFAGLCLLAFVLVLFTNLLTVLLSFVAVALAASYPFMKRYTYLPQVVLGAAFAWAVPMAFAAQTHTVAPSAWLVYAIVVVWTVTYDTFYAMVDREDDLKIGVKSTAILFGEQDKIITGSLQAMTWFALFLLGDHYEQLGIIYFISLAVVAGLFIYQQQLIKHRNRDQCFKAFLNNNWVGATVFLGLFLDFLI